MELLVARGLELWRSGSRLFGPLDLTLKPGMRVALTGSWDAGLSELLELLAGQLPAESGLVRLAPGTTLALADRPGAIPAGTTVWDYAARALEPLEQLERQLRLLEQRLDSAAALARYGELAESFEAAGGYQAEAELRQLLAAFGLPVETHDREVQTLSGGQQQRLELARSLVGRPDVLLLADPAAGLDAQMRDQLAARLARWPGAVVFSSHDRQFINAAASHTAELRSSSFSLRRGGFSRRSVSRSAAAGSERRQLLASRGLKLPLGSDALLSSGPFTVSAGERIVLLGANGSGKSSLLAHLAHDLHSGTGNGGVHWHEPVKLRYADQLHAGLDPELSPLHNLTRLMSQQRARQLLGLVRLNPQQHPEPAGELDRATVARTGLAALLADESDLLLLDEPETGLDLPGTLLLEDALLDHAGAVILVTHDRQLASNFASRVWAIEDGELRDYRGGMDGYLSGRLRLEDDLQLPESAAEPAVETVDELEEQLRQIDDRLSDTLELPERQAQRLQRRQRELISQLMELYDAEYPQPEPRYQVREDGLLVEADLTEDGSLLFSGLDGVRPVLRVRAGVAHLQLVVSADRCLLPWAVRALVNAASRLAFYALNVRLVQYWSADAPPGLLLEPAGSGWHALARSRFEQLEGWRRRSRRRRRRRLQEQVA